MKPVKKKLPKKMGPGEKLDAKIADMSKRSVSELKNMRRANETVDKARVAEQDNRIARTKGQGVEGENALASWRGAMTDQATNRYVNTKASQIATEREAKAGSESAAEIMRKGGMAKAPKK